MANEKILLRAKAHKLGIDGYRTMGTDELKAAIASAEKGTTAKGKGKSSPNGSKGKGKATEAVAKATGKKKPAAKGKSTAAPAKGKSTVQKSSPAKATAAKGKASRAASTKGKGKASTAKGKVMEGKKTPKATPAKAKATAKPAAKRSAKSAPARVDIDRSKIDWKAESNVGKTGKRADVMSALRKRKGNYDKVFEDLQPNAKRYYPGKTKHEAERTLRWLINRVAFDFVMATGQHTPGQRAEYGTSTNPADVRRRERRAAAQAEAAKAERKAKRSAPAKKAAKRTPVKAKASAKKTAAAKGKAKAKRR